MNLSELQQKLIAAARSNPPSDAVPYAFEKRLLARLAGRPVVDNWALWSRALWRALLRSDIRTLWLMLAITLPSCMHC